MNSATTPHRNRTHTNTAIGLLVAAVIVWSVQLCRLRPGRIQQHLDAGRQYTQLGQARQAEREWMAALQLDPKNPVVLESLAELYYTTENWAAAAPLYLKLTELKPDRPHTFTQLAVCLLRSGDEKGGFNAAQEELKHDPNEDTAVLISAILLSKMGDLPQEEKYLERLLQRTPDDLFVLTLAAENRTFSHDYATARPVLDRMLRIDPQSAEAYLLRGICDFDENPFAEGQARAEDGFVHALKLNPLLPLARLYLGKLYKRQGKAAQALFQLEEAHRLSPARTDVLFDLAGAYERAGQPRKAMEARRRFEALRQATDLQASLEKKCAVYPDKFDPHLQLGMLFLDKQDAYRAGIFLRMAAALRPGESHVQEGMRRLEALQAQITPKEPTAVRAAVQSGRLR